MKIEISKRIGKACKIVPYDNLAGVIIAENHSRSGVEFQVRYFLNGEYKKEWYFDFDIDIEI